MTVNIFAITEFQHRIATMDCVKSITHQDINAHIFVGNDGAKDLNFKSLPPAHVIDWPDNVNYVKNTNRTVSMALHEWEEKHLDQIVLFICNNDLEFQLGSIELLSNYAKENNCIVGPSLIVPRKWVKADGHSIHPQMHGRMGVKDLNTRPIIKMTAISGCLMVMPVRIWLELNGYDEKFIVYFSDDDFCIRATKAGYPVLYLPQALVYHEVAITLQNNKIMHRHAAELSRIDYKVFQKKHPKVMWDNTGCYK